MILNAESRISMSATKEIQSKTLAIVTLTFSMLSGLITGVPFRSFLNSHYTTGMLIALRVMIPPHSALRFLTPQL